MNKTNGQTTLERIEQWLAGFVVFPNEHMALVAALWAINTYVFGSFDATPYLAITARTKQAGKTTLLELLSFLARNAERIGVGTMAPTLYGLMDSYDTKCSLFFDEAERMSRGTATVMSGMMNSGYRRGETVPRTVKGEIVKFGCYCPKAFALIGDPSETLRDRSILFVLARAIGARAYRPSTAQAESIELVSLIESAVEGMAGAKVVCPDWLSNRDQEIWEPLWSVAVALGCDARLLARLRKASEWLVAGKGAELRRYTETADSEAAWEASQMGEKAIRDLAACFKTGEKVVFSEEAVRRMRAASGTWDNYKGEGLTALTLSRLVAGLGVKPYGVRVPGEDTQRRGYSRKSVFASVPSEALKLRG